MKMAKKFHRNRGDAGRCKFISRRGSYHGATHGCLSLGGGGANNGAEYGPLPVSGVRVQGPDQDRAVTAGIVRPGYSYCTYGYLLSPSGLRALLDSGFERALIPVDELIPALLHGSPARGHPVAVPQAPAGLRLRAAPRHPTAEGRGRKRHRGQRLRAGQQAPGRPAVAGGTAGRYPAAAPAQVIGTSSAGGGPPRAPSTCSTG